jgi:hypothetical protein
VLFPGHQNNKKCSGISATCATWANVISVMDKCSSVQVLGRKLLNRFTLFRWATAGILETTNVASFVSVVYVEPGDNGSHPTRSGSTRFVLTLTELHLQHSWRSRSIMSFGAVQYRQTERLSTQSTVSPSLRLCQSLDDRKLSTNFTQLGASKNRSTPFIT